jgi:lysophospholipase L1-like esterase
MPIGDSITQANNEHDSYRRPLWHELDRSGYQVDFVGSENLHHEGAPPHPDFDMDHEGHWGWRTDEILERIDEWARVYEPHVVLIHLGSNDVFQNQSTESTIDELRQLIDRLRLANPKVKIALAQIIPVNHPRKLNAIRDLNDRIETLGTTKSRKGSPVAIVDLFTGFDVQRDTYDGVHPNVSGEEKMARVWLSALEQLLNQ